MTKKILTGVLVTGLIFGLGLIFPKEVKAADSLTITVTPNGGTEATLATTTADAENISLGTNCTDGCTIGLGTQTANTVSIVNADSFDDGVVTLAGATGTTPTITLTSAFKDAVKVKFSDRVLTFVSPSYVGFDIVSSTEFANYANTYETETPFVKDKNLTIFYGTDEIYFKLLKDKDGTELGKGIKNITTSTNGYEITAVTASEQSTKGEYALTTDYKSNTAKRMYFHPVNKLRLVVTYNDDTTGEIFINLNKKALKVTSDTTNKQVTATYYGISNHGFCSAFASNQCTLNTKFDPYLNVLYYKDNAILGMKTFKVKDGTSDPASLNFATMDTGVAFNYTTTILKNTDEYAEADKVGIFISESKLNSDAIPVLDYGIEEGYEAEIDMVGEQ